MYKFYYQSVTTTPKFVRMLNESFKNLRAMVRFAKNENNTGDYYIEHKGSMFVFTREEILEL